jgi:hypothetical protein
MRCNSSFIAATHHLCLAHALSQEAQDGGASTHGAASTPRIPEAYAKVLKVLDPLFSRKGTEAKEQQSNLGNALSLESQATLCRGVLRQSNSKVAVALLSNSKVAVALLRQRNRRICTLSRELRQSNSKATAPKHLGNTKQQQQGQSTSAVAPL